MADLLAGIVTGWHADPMPLLAAVTAAVLYATGARRRARNGGAGTPPTEAVCFTLGVATIVVALVSPLDGAALRLQWAHMVQHVLLLLVAPPLVVLSRPLDTAILPLAPDLHAGLRRLSSTRLGTHRNQVVAATMALTVFVAVLWLWHVPALYDLTLRNEPVHDLEHTAFLATGLLFWAVALDRVAWAAAVSTVGRAAIVTAAMIGSWMLAVYIGYAPVVLYAYHGSGALSALSDQQLAAGVMWVPGSIPFVLALVYLGVRWFEADARAAAEPSSHGGLGG